ncbi:hypothetical protein [Nocardia sp. CY41]|uniref:hypothetical protein n=1 Tax=Nocardia sp. CY41 TaxID=2608686 RepID=UPI001915E237|nr:hypothetical protein [Nocardia sp. CY41]
MIESTDHQYIGMLESAAVAPDKWQQWVTDVERLLGHTADGDHRRDGYSLDGFYDLWKRGLGPVEAVHGLWGTPGAARRQDCEIRATAADDWDCRCGNRSDLDGFSACDAHGRDRDPADTDQADLRYRCDRCALIVNPTTYDPNRGTVRGIAPTSPPA